MGSSDAATVDSTKRRPHSAGSSDAATVNNTKRRPHSSGVLRVSNDHQEPEEEEQQPEIDLLDEDLLPVGSASMTSGFQAVNSGFEDDDDTLLSAILRLEDHLSSMEERSFKRLSSIEQVLSVHQT